MWKGQFIPKELWPGWETPLSIPIFEQWYDFLYLNFIQFLIKYIPDTSGYKEYPGPELVSVNVQ